MTIESAAYFSKNISNLAKSPKSRQIFRRLCTTAPPSHARAKSVKMSYLLMAITFFGRGRFQIWKVLRKCVCMLYNICENQPKISIPTFISDVQGKPVQKCAAALAAARIAAWDSSTTLLWMTVTALGSNQFSICWWLCYWGPILHKLSKIQPNPPCLAKFSDDNVKMLLPAMRA